MFSELPLSVIKMIHEIAIVGRGGQGGVSMAKMMAYAAFIEGKHGSAIPKYGAERRGAPVISSLRISDQPLKLHSQIRDPQHIIALEVGVIPKLIPPKKLGEGSIIAVNATEIPEIVKQYEPTYVAYVDAANVARSVGLVRSGTPIASVPMMAAFAKASGILKKESLIKAVPKLVSDPSLQEKNVKAIEKAFEETVVKKIE